MTRIIVNDFLNDMADECEKLANVETLPTVIGLYYPIKNEGDETGWRYQVTDITLTDIVMLLTIIKDLTEQR